MEIDTIANPRQLSALKQEAALSRDSLKNYFNKINY
jgi:hypothetical protein